MPVWREENGCKRAFAVIDALLLCSYSSFGADSELSDIEMMAAREQFAGGSRALRRHRCGGRPVYTTVHTIYRRSGSNDVNVLNQMFPRGWLSDTRTVLTFARETDRRRHRNCRMNDTSGDVTHDLVPDGASTRPRAAKAHLYRAFSPKHIPSTNSTRSTPLHNSPSKTSHKPSLPTFHTHHNVWNIIRRPSLRLRGRRSAQPASERAQHRRTLQRGKGELAQVE